MNISIGEISHPVLHIPRNSHEIWEVVYYTVGEGVNIIKGEKIPICPGRIIFQPPEYAHEEFSQNGFDDAYHFSRVFKKKAGVSPTKWRNGCKHRFENAEKPGGADAVPLK